MARVIDSRLFWQRLVVFLLIALAIWLPRGLALDRLVTPDEPRWLTRSANFYEALAHGRWADTYQTAHPGVTVMWLGMTAYWQLYPSYPADEPGQFARWGKPIEPFLEAHGHEPLELLAAGRWAMVLAVTGVLTAAFGLSVRLLGWWPSVLGSLFIAGDPFHIAHSRLLHLDGLMSSLMLLAVLAFLVYLYRGRRPVDLLLSAVAAALACLTKAPALFLVLLVALLFSLEWVRQWRKEGRPDWKALWALPVWGIVAVFVFVLLWPAMWVNPLESLNGVVRGAGGHALNAHEDPLYFNGAIVDGDPGPAFYPATYLWRTTPFVLAGLALAALAYLTSLWGTRPLNLAKVPNLRKVPTPIVLALTLYPLLFMLFMTFGAKKFDRYLLPVFPPLDLLAAVGWVAAAQGLAAKRPVAARALFPVVLLGLTAGQIVSAASTFPYYLHYYNPLLGGTAGAQRGMMVGWGEGLDQAAAYLNSEPAAAEEQVLTGVWDGTFSYFYAGKVERSWFGSGTDTLEAWRASDYCVIYVNQWQRGRLPAELLTYLDSLTPLQVIRLQGVDYVYIYDIRGVPPPAYLWSEPAAQTNESSTRRLHPQMQPRFK
jgi:hypothetical protein